MTDEMDRLILNSGGKKNPQREETNTAAEDAFILRHSLLSFIILDEYFIGFCFNYSNPSLVSLTKRTKS